GHDGAGVFAGGTVADLGARPSGVGGHDRDVRLLASAYATRVRALGVAVNSIRALAWRLSLRHAVLALDSALEHGAGLDAGCDCGVGEVFQLGQAFHRTRVMGLRRTYIHADWSQPHDCASLMAI